MYPNLYYFFKDVFGVEVNGLKLINSFGFFVAICFITAAWIVTLELKRKQQLGLLTFTEEKITIGAPATIGELLSNFFLGFLFGYKIIGAFVIPNALSNPQAFILSIDGNVVAGLTAALFFAGLKWYEKNKQKLAKPQERTIRIWPHDKVGDLVIYAAIFGFSGAKIFHNLENWNDFVKDPIGALISFSGLTFYGGLICAAIAIAVYAKLNKIVIIHLADSFAPALMIGYAIGRIGCQVAGDGDWGILNSSFISNSSGHLIAATQTQFKSALQTNQLFYLQQFGSLGAVKHLSITPFLHLSNWLFAYNYPHNVINEGVPMANCTGQYCTQLPIAVFPTPFYETIACTCIFFVLWTLRKKLPWAGQMSGIYLILNGLERFFIEKIRVNTKYEALPFQPTQAELIAVFLIVIGIIILFFANKIKLKISNQ